MFFIIGIVLAGLSALLHVYIFVLESVRWTLPSTRRIFGVRSEEDARTMQPLAFNQGFYNLFLAVMTAVGIVIGLAGSETIGVTLMVAGTGTMLAAALVLVIADRSKLRAAVLQGTFPLLAVLFLIAAEAVATHTS
jgi:putative membrane protein